MERKKNYIGGKWRESKKKYELFSPYNNKKIAEIPLCNEQMVYEAISSAHKKFEVIKKTPAHERSAILERVVQIMGSRQNELAKIISLENAKPIKAARTEIARTIQTYKFAAEEAKRLYGETIPMDAAIGAENKFGYTRREPIGVIAAITPFNFPFNLVAHKLGPAIAAGNSIVLKPASQTPLSALKIAEIFEEAGLPPGVLNVITGRGSEIGDILVEDPRVKMVTFTGSLEVGLSIRKKSGLKRVTLELGSNSPVIVDDIKDIDFAVEKCVIGSFAYSGQVCISVQRIYVHEVIYQEFVNKFNESAKRLKVGDPLSEDTDVSALINPNETKRVQGWISEALDKGSELAQGGSIDGNSLTPTVMLNVPADVSLCSGEAFAPIVAINSFKTWEEGIAMANNSEFGLQAGAFTDSFNNALVATELIESGGVIINDVPTFRVDHMPYGGVKNSGVGKEGIKYSVEEMTELKFVAFNIR